MYKEEYYDYSGKEGKWIKDELKKRGFHHVTISNFPADFFRMSKSQLEKLFEKASDSFISEMYDVPIQQIQNRRSDFEIKQLGCTINRMWREEELAQTVKEILRIVSNEYNNGNIPHTNSTPLNSEKEFLYMKATGIVRRIDDLGRVVIPKEIRRTMRIREGDPLEIFTNREGEVIFKKYSAMESMSQKVQVFADALSRATAKPAAVCDRDTVLAVAGIPKKDYQERGVSESLADRMHRRENYVRRAGDATRATLTESGAASLSVVVPIISESDCIGAIILLTPENGAVATEQDIRLASLLAAVLASEMAE